MIFSELRRAPAFLIFRKRNSQRGFTLIEVLITITILSTISVLVAQTISQGLKAKAKIQEQIDQVSRLRDALRLIEKDVNLAFHYRDLELEMKALIKKKSPSSGGGSGGIPPGGGTQAQPEAPELPPEATRVDPITQFVGTDQEMNFVTMNTSRLFSEAAQADFIEVGYTLKDCKSIKSGKANSKCLWRRTSTEVDTDVTKGGGELVLLENVEEFKLRYFGKGKQDWNSSWRSDSGGDLVTKNAFPELVEVSITVKPQEADKQNEKQKKFSMQFVIPVHFTNNPTDDEKKKLQ